MIIRSSSNEDDQKMIISWSKLMLYGQRERKHKFEAMWATWNHPVFSTVGHLGQSDKLQNPWKNEHPPSPMAVSRKSLRCRSPQSLYCYDNSRTIASAVLSISLNLKFPILLVKWGLIKPFRPFKNPHVSCAQTGSTGFVTPAAPLCFRRHGAGCTLFQASEAQREWPRPE